MSFTARSMRRHPARARTVGMVGVAAVLLSACAAQDVSAEVAGEETSVSPPKAQEQIKHRKVRITKEIPFETDLVETSQLAAGQREVQQAGEEGVRVRVMRLSIRAGEVVDRELVRKFVVREPVDRVVLVGTRVDPEPAPEPESFSGGGGCDPNYSGSCVPVASDVDCAGGSGDGPEYADGPVRIVGSDIYDLDRDGDGIACDS